MRKRSLAACLLLAFSLLLATPAAYAADYVQIGTRGADGNNPLGFGAASKMTQPALSPEYPSGMPWKYYWVAITFQDGTFYQVGYADPASNQTCSGLMNFVTVFQGRYYHTNVGQCGLTGTRTFGLVIKNAGDATLWAAQMDNQELAGNTVYAPASFKSNDAIAVSEVSTDSQFSGSAPGLPSVTYSPAVHFKNASGAWVPQAHGAVYRGYKGTQCPTYYIDPLGGSAARVYSATSGTCRQDGALLW